MVLLYPVSMGLAGSFGNGFVGRVASVSSVLFGMHMFLTLLLLLVDASRLVHKFPDKPTAFAVIGLAVLLTAVGAFRAGGFRVTELEIPIDGLEGEVTLMHISDVHLGPQRGRGYLERIVRETNRLEPDAVLINGDLVDGASALDSEVLQPLADFEAPVFFTTGNHEAYVDQDRALEIIEEKGVRILRNEAVEVAGLQLVGLDYMSADLKTYDMHRVNYLTIEEELPKIPIDPERPVVLMHHSPVGLDYVSVNGIDLMVAGHTHAGQVFPATLFARFLFPLSKGLHERNGTKFYVSQGAGTFGPRMRLGSSNEIDLIRLTPNL
jgi:predicted MPP superfamily phosphohydrolase